MSVEHYLKKELDTLVSGDPATWQFIQQGSLDGVWYWDLENPDNEWMSPEFWQLFGINPDERTHNPSQWQDIIFKEDLEVALENFNRHCEDADHPYDQIVRYRHADGSTIWVRCRGIAVRDENGKPIRMLGAHNDLTAVKRAQVLASKEAHLANHALELAQEANDELKAFAYGLSHDLKAPMNTISRILGEITEDEDALNDKHKFLLEAGKDTVERMQTLLENLVNYTRMTERYAHIDEISMGEVVQEVLARMQDEIQACEAEVNLDEIPNLNVSQQQIGMVMEHLISNALKYKKPDVAPIIDISSRHNTDKNMYEISVTDNGIGIASGHHHQIFEMFSRLHRYDEVKGSGMGLAICKRVLTNHAGEISVKSTRGEGATFTIGIPIRE